jgi:3-oxoacyl-[acyl-carrier-protein] synthase II
MGAGRRVVVTGLGLATPLGINMEENWRKAMAGVSGIDRLTLPGAEKSAVQAVGEVKAQDWQRICEAFPEDAGSEGEKRNLFALWAAQSALRDAGLPDAKPLGNRAGVSLAVGIGADRLEDIERWTQSDGQFDLNRFGREWPLIHRESILRNNSNRAAALLARRFRLAGNNITITAACASATQAIGLAFRSIRTGHADVMVAGGVDSMFNPVGLIFFVLLKVAAVSATGADEIYCAFDRRRSGLVMAEGAAIAVLEEESHARRRGAKIYAEVAGYGSSMDAYRLTAPHPDGRGAEQAMRGALNDAGLSIDDIDYINAHATATKLNDITETLAVKNLFQDRAYRVAISSSKSLIGHLLAASGAPEFIYTVLSVQRDAIHPTINLMHPDPKCDLDYVPSVSRVQRVRAALSNSFGFGGQNASIVVRKHTGEMNPLRSGSSQRKSGMK